jgi:hypothetical protein
LTNQKATNTDFATRTLNGILQTRGILAAAQKAHWQPQGNRWKYPIYDLSGEILTYRYKATKSDSKPKYWWDGHKPDDCHYYLLPGLQEAIHQYKGLLYIASGEPDVLAFKSAGIDNVLCWFGETSVPPDLAAFLRELGVQYVIAYPDCDHTGTKAAEKIAVALQGSSIHFYAAALPNYLGEKGDINKLWQHVEFERDAFIAALANDTQALEIKPAKPKSQRSKPKYADTSHHTYYATIEQALGIDAYKGNGWSKQAVACLFHTHEHDDTQPAAHWHRDKHILKCFKCGETYLAKQVGAALGIEWKDFTAAPDNLPRPTLDTFSTALGDDAVFGDLYHFLQGIPDTLREALLSLHCKTNINDHCPALIVLELRQQAIAEQQLAPAQPLTVNWLIDYTARIDWYTSEGVIRRGLKQLEALGFLHINPSEAEGKVPAALRGGKGRPTDHYHPQPLAEALTRLHEALRYRIRERIFGDKIPDTVTPEWFANEAPAHPVKRTGLGSGGDEDPELAQQFADAENTYRQDLYDEFYEARRIAEQQYEREVNKMQGGLSLNRLLLAHSTALVDDLPCQDSQGYRALLYRSLIVAAGEEGRTIARAKAAAQLGTSDKTLSVLRLKAGIAADEQFEMMEIIDPQNVLEQVNEQFPWAAERDFGKFLDNGSGKRKGLYNRPEEIDCWVRYELGNNCTIIAYVQTASRERLATEQEQRGQAQVYEDRRERQRTRYQSRPPRESDKLPNLLEELLAQAIEEACPPTFSTTYMLRQIALLPHTSEMELLAYLDLFSNLHPLREADISRGGKYENKWDARILYPPQPYASAEIGRTALSRQPEF